MTTDGQNELFPETGPPVAEVIDMTAKLAAIRAGNEARERMGRLYDPNSVPSEQAIEQGRAVRPVENDHDFTVADTEDLAAVNSGDDQIEAPEATRADSKNGRRHPCFGGDVSVDAASRMGAVPLRRSLPQSYLDARAELANKTAAATKKADR
jgi:hypothetical protein